MDKDALSADKAQVVSYEGGQGATTGSSQCEAIFDQAKTLFDLHRLYVAITYGSYHARVRKDNAVVEANFKNINIDLLSPAFLFPHKIPEGFQHGTASPTSHHDFDEYLREIAARNQWATYSLADFKSEGGQSFPFLHLTNSAQSVTLHNSRIEKLKIWVQAGVHGSEPAGDQALLALVGRMDANQAWTSSLLEKLEILLLPRYNPDGVAKFQRTLLSNLDPNRDHIKMAGQNTRDIKKLFTQFAPHIAIDMHEYSAATVYGGKYQQASDCLFAAAKNLNIHNNIRSISEKLFARNLGKDLDAVGLRWEPYVKGAMDGSTIVLTEAGSDARIGRNAMGLTQCISFLTETRGIGLADQEFQRRTAASLAMVQSIIRTAADNASEVYRTLQDSISDFILDNGEIVVTDSPRSRNRSFTMVNNANGNIEQVTVRFLSTTPAIKKLTRLRPAAYLIPKSRVDLASRLQDLEVVVDRLADIYRGTVEAYRLTSVLFGDTYYEGVVPVTVQAQIEIQKVELEAGAYWVSTKQKNAALAFVAIEPENVDSWVSLNILPVSVGCQLPIFRVPN